jgi:hypothetical protein
MPPQGGGSLISEYPPPNSWQFWHFLVLVGRGTFGVGFHVRLTLGGQPLGNLHRFGQHH